MLTVDELNDLVTTKTAAERIGVSQGRIRQWAARGKITKLGLDEHGRPMYRLIDVMRAERAARQTALGKRTA